MNEQAPRAIEILGDQVERRSTAKLIPYARNARTHSDEQVAQIAASMREFGFTFPVLIDEADGIIAGHGRVLAAGLLEMPEAPVIVARGWSEAKKRAYIIADNKLGLNSDWNKELLRLELADLKEFSFDLALTGFGATELRGIFAGGSSEDPELTPAAPATPVSRLGDLWLLGDHRLICGDACDPRAVTRLLDGARPGLMVTDPPYGVEYDPTWREKVPGGFSTGENRARGEVTNDSRADWSEAWRLFPGDVAYVWHADKFASAVDASLRSVGFDIRCLIVWAKSAIVVGRGHYHFQHEGCWYAVKPKGQAHWMGGRKQSTLWPIANMHATQGNADDGKTQHSTQKPVECMKRPMENNSLPGDAVYDPFLGSGTTLIAADMLGRICFGLEIAPAYCDVIVQRWEKFTGKVATLEREGRAGDGMSFAEVAAARIEDEHAWQEADPDSAAQATRQPESEADAGGRAAAGGQATGGARVADARSARGVGLRDRKRARGPAKTH